MCYKSIVSLLCITISYSYGSVVTFLPSTRFDLPINFKDGKVPCSRETVVFPDTVLTSIRLESETSVSGFVLPREGDISLADATILFGADETDVNCTHDGNVYYLQKAVAKWSQPDVWSSPRFNDATPDAERVPCFDDIVKFPANAEFTLSLPDISQSVLGIEYNNYTCKTQRVCIEVLMQLPDKFIVNKFYMYGLRFNQERCLSRAGCPCQQHPTKINCEVKYCSVPTCVDPIKPEGHCCKICGGVIKFDIDESFDMMIFRELVEKTVESYGTANLEYHLGRLPNNKVQLVVVDKVEYSGISAEVVNSIDHQMQRHWVQGAKLVDISGSPLEMSGLGVKIFISMFFLVVLTMVGIYAYYYKFSEGSDLRFSILDRSTSGVFLRFQRRTDSVVCLTRSDSQTTIGRGPGTAFRNPLYDSGRQREELEETGTDE